MCLNYSFSQKIQVVRIAQESTGLFFLFFQKFFYIPFFLPPAQYNVGVKMHGLVDEANLH